MSDKWLLYVCHIECVIFSKCSLHYVTHERLEGGFNFSIMFCKGRGTWTTCFKFNGWLTMWKILCHMYIQFITTFSEPVAKEVINKESIGIAVGNCSTCFVRPMFDKTRQILEDFFHPYNKMTAELLNDNRWIFK